MPCHDGGVPYPASNHERLSLRNQGKDEATATFEPLLCSACRSLERLGYDFDENPALSVWWAEHKAVDDAKQAEAERRRVKNEFQARILADALKKTLGELSPEEIALLKQHKYL